MSEDPNARRVTASPSTSGDASRKKPLLPSPDDEDDRVIITKGEDFRLYQRTIWEILDDGGPALYLVIGVFIIAIVGTVLILSS